MTQPTTPRSIHDSATLDIAQLIQGLGLQGTTGVCGDIGTNVVAQLVEEMLDLNFPCVIVTNIGESEVPDFKSFETDGIIYPVAIHIRDQMAPNYQLRRPVYLYWRYTIAKYLRGLVAQPVLPNTPECFNIEINYLPIAAHASNAQIVEVSLKAMCWTSEAMERG